MPGRWANNVLKQFVIQGYAVNQKRLNDLGGVVKLLKRTENSLDAKTKGGSFMAMGVRLCQCSGRHHIYRY